MEIIHLACGERGRQAEEGPTQARELWVRTEVMCVRGGALGGVVVEAKPGRKALTGVSDGAVFSIQLHDLPVLASVATQGKSTDNASYKKEARALLVHSTKAPCPPAFRKPLKGLGAQGNSK